MEDFGLTVKEIEKIQSVFKQYQKIETVTIYGSRAKGTYKIASDIDLSLKGNQLDSEIQQNVLFNLDDLMLPYKFDITVYDRISNPEFKNHIDRIGKVFYQK